jgi:membrane protease YdiL (CAAX protease family)
MEEPARRWGLGDVLVGFAVGFGGSLIAGGAYLSATGRETADDIPLSALALLQIPLWVGLFGVPLVATGIKGRGPVEDLGLRARPGDVPVGLLVGALTQLVLIPLLYVPVLWLLRDIDREEISEDARRLTDQAHGGGVLLLVLVVVICAPIAEEVFYRGLLLRALEPRLGRVGGLLTQAGVFGLSHFQAIQFPALVLFGLVAGILAQRTGRLGPGIAAHMAFNGTAVFTLLALDWS